MGYGVESRVGYIVRLVKKLKLQNKKAIIIKRDF